MALKKSFSCIAVILISVSMLGGLCLSPPSSIQAQAADRSTTQFGEFTAMSLLSSLGKALGKAAAKKGAEWAMGSVMKSLGFGKPTTRDIMNKLDSDMAEINQKLDQIAAGINDLANEMTKYFDKSQALSNYKDLDTYCTTVKTAYDDWMLKWMAPYIGDKDNPKIPPQPGTAEYDAMVANLTKWSNFMAGDTYGVSNAMGQIHQDLVGSARSVLQGIVDVGIDEAAVEWGGNDFSTTVESTNGVPVVADRVMYTRGDLTGSFCGGGAEAKQDHYFAEGYAVSEGEATGKTFILIQNSDASRSANVNVTFFLSNGEKKTLDLVVKPHSRYTVVAGDHVSGEFGIKVKSDIDISVERSCYLGGKLSDATVNADAGLDLKKTFAEGYVVPDYFDTYFTLMNPDPEKTAKVNATFFKNDGTTGNCSVEVGPEKRFTIDAGNYVQGEFSTILESTNGVPVVSERVVYGSDGLGDRVLGGATASEGETDFSTSRYFAEGYVVPGYFSTFYSLLNPGNEPASATFSFLKSDSSTVEHKVNVDPGKRVTVNAGDFVEGEFATNIESTKPITSERITYAQPGSGGALCGANIGEGSDEARTEWSFAEGTNRKDLGARTFITIGNPGENTAQVEVTFQTAEGKTHTRTVSIPPRRSVTSQEGVSEVSGYGGRMTVDAGVEVQSAEIENWYEKLEDTFVGAVYQRSSAANMTVEYMGYLNQDPQYWWNNYISEETVEVQKFLEQAYRLAMSQVELVEQPGHDPFFPDVSKRIINRANFVANIILNKCDYQNPDSAEYAADLANQCRLLGTVVLGGEVAGKDATVTVSAVPDKAGATIEGKSTYTTGYVEKFRPSASQRVREYYDAWNETAMTPRKDFSVFTFSLTGVIAGSLYDVTIHANGKDYSAGKFAAQSVDPDGQPYDKTKSVARIDYVPFVYYYRTGGLAGMANLIRKYGQPYTDPNFYNANVSISKDSGGFLISGYQRTSAPYGPPTNALTWMKLTLKLNVPDDGGATTVRFYPYLKLMRWLHMKYSPEGGTTELSFFNVKSHDHLSAQGGKVNTRGGNWEDCWGKSQLVSFSLPNANWDPRIYLYVNTGGSGTAGYADVETQMAVTGFCPGFY